VERWGRRTCGHGEKGGRKGEVGEGSGRPPGLDRFQWNRRLGGAEARVMVRVVEADWRVGRTGSRLMTKTGVVRCQPGVARRRKRGGGVCSMEGDDVRRGGRER
jgi:hypothetical protein